MTSSSPRPEPADTGLGAPPRPGRAAAGELITKDRNHNILGHTTVPRWLAAHRTPTLTRWSLVFTTLGGTVAVVTAAAMICLVFVAMTRHWRPASYLVTLLLGELAMFLTAAAVVKRPRPSVTHLDHHLPTCAFPSGHVAATCCLYAGLAILVIGSARDWWRWLFLIPAITPPVLVAASRMYRGEHHPTDVLASFVFAALWIPVVTLLIKPGRRPSARLPAGSGGPAGRGGIWRGVAAQAEKVSGLSPGNRCVIACRQGGTHGLHRQTSQ